MDVISSTAAASVSSSLFADLRSSNGVTAWRGVEVCRRSFQFTESHGDHSQPQLCFGGVQFDDGLVGGHGSEPLKSGETGFHDDLLLPLQGSGPLDLIVHAEHETAGQVEGNPGLVGGVALFEAGDLAGDMDLVSGPGEAHGHDRRADGDRGEQQQDDPGQAGHAGRAAAPPQQPPSECHATGRDRLVVDPPQQVLCQIARRFVPEPFVLSHRFLANRFDIAGYGIVELSWRTRLVVENLGERHPKHAAERDFSGQQFVKHHTQAVDVGPLVDLSWILDLFG